MQQECWMGGEDAERPTKGMPQGRPPSEKVIRKQDDDDMAKGRQPPSAPRPPRTEPNPQV